MQVWKPMKGIIKWSMVFGQFISRCHSPYDLRHSASAWVQMDDHCTLTADLPDQSTWWSKTFCSVWVQMDDRDRAYMDNGTVLGKTNASDVICSTRRTGIKTGVYRPLCGISISYFHMTGDMRRFPEGDLIYKRYLQRYGKSCCRQRLTEKIKELFKQLYEEYWWQIDQQILSNNTYLHKNYYGETERYHKKNEYK